MWSKILTTQKHSHLLRPAFTLVTYAYLSKKYKLVTFLHFIFALVCVSINHQKGEIGREMAFTISSN
jgi:hypothetical protein